MNWEQLLIRENELIGMVGVLGGRAVQDIVFKIAFIRTIMDRLEPGSQVPRGVVLNLLEELKISLSEREARTLLLDAGLVELVEDDLRVPRIVTTRGVFPELLPVPPEYLTEQVLAWLRLSRTSAVQSSQQCPTTLACLLSINRSLNWALQIASAARRADLDGIPVFWECSQGTYVPFTSDPGTLTTSDTLLLIGERARQGFKVPPLAPDELDTVVWLWKLLLRLQRQGSTWDGGAFNVPRWDDDFVGCYLDTHRDRGPCPTVDATANSVLALASMLKSGILLQADLQTGTSLREATISAIGHGVEFILRCQGKVGGWPIYRYEDDQFGLPVRDICSRFAVDALAEVARLAVIPQVVCERVRAALIRYLQMAESTLHHDGAGAYWVPNFTRPHARKDEKVQATATTQLSLDAAARAFPELATTVAGIRKKTTAFVAQTWEPDPDRFARISFRVPTWDGPAETQAQWELPADPMIVSMLLAFEKYDNPHDLDLRASAVNAVGTFLAQEKDGYWVDFLMRKEGKNRAMPGNTMHYHRALLDFLAWNQRVLDALGSCDLDVAGRTLTGQHLTAEPLHPSGASELTSAAGDTRSA